MLTTRYSLLATRLCLLAILYSLLATAALAQPQRITSDQVFSGPVRFTGAITPAQITADQNDYAPTGLGTANTLRLSSDAAHNITGLAAGSTPAGLILFVHNIGSFNLVLVNASAASVAANRFAFSADVTLSAGSSVILQYDSTAARWHALGSGGGSATPTTTEGDLIVRGAAADQRLAIGTNGYVLTVDTTLSGKTKWAEPGLTNPMTTAGDLIYGGTAGAPARLAIGTAGQAIRVNAGATGYEFFIPGTGAGTVNSGTANQLAYYAATGTAVSGLATANNAVLVTSGTGVPSLSTTLPSMQVGTFTFGASGGTMSGASGALTLAAAGTNQNITLTPSGTGIVAVNSPLTSSFSVAGGGGAGLTVTNTNASSRANGSFTNNSGLGGGFAAYGSTFTVAGLQNNFAVFADRSLNFSSDGNTVSGGTYQIQFTTGGYSNSPTLTISGGNPGVVAAVGRFTVGATTASTSTSTGALVNAGGFGNAGAAWIGGLLNVAGDLQLAKTITAAGTTGAATINKNTGSVNLAAAATSLVVTNSLVTVNSVITCTVGTNDSTCKSVAAVAAAGSFTIYSDAAPTAETRVNFHVTN